ncbi:hypothetical protein ACSQ67_008594 [Phaseolus vulgaris]
MLHSNSVNLPAIASSTPKPILPHTKNPTHLTLPFFPAAIARERVQRPPLAAAQPPRRRTPSRVPPCRHRTACATSTAAVMGGDGKRGMTAAKACGPTFSEGRPTESIEVMRSEALATNSRETKDRRTRRGRGEMRELSGD